MNLRVLVVPYDSGLRAFRMGNGPERLLRAGVAEALRTAGHAVEVEHVEVAGDVQPAEIRTAFELNRLLADRVRAAADADALPIVLAGNCITATGTLAGLGPGRRGVVWLDAHGDFNTPETTTGGFLDGMALAVATGRCWRQLAATVPGHRPVAEGDVVLLGTRDLDPLEAELLAGSAITVLPPGRVRRELTDVLESLRRRTEEVYLHVDLDVLDPADARANALAAPDGLRLAEVRAAIEQIRRLFRVRAVALTAYDPECDPDGRAAGAAIDLLRSAVPQGPAPAMTYGSLPSN